ncbi:type III PLP-dependent enzyme [Paracoccus luteus]|uniref:type III PLP-dependent enzyme n=1 Tax=Paracoccus luteus TaxID=2508543 RepID=UPI001FE37183|nr:type III PLP-dependent enzyme [Paracoccus luteus]
MSPPAADLPGGWSGAAGAEGDLWADDLAPPDDAILTRAAAAGTPLYLYDLRRVAARAARLRTAFRGRLGLSFAVKANPNPTLLRALADMVDTLDVSSGGELAQAAAAGWDAGRTSFTGPAKRAPEIGAALAAGLGELVVESLAEARMADAAAAGLGLRQKVVARIAPDRVPKGFGDQMAGRPSPFGIDAEEAADTLAQIAALRNLRLAGLHFYSGTQCLRADAVVENWRIFIGLARDLAPMCADGPLRLILGAGLGIPYHLTDTPLDLQAIADDIAPDLDALAAEGRFARPLLELGRYLVGPAGWFLTRVVAVKQSRGQRIALCDGGMNAHLAASGHFGMVIHRNYRLHLVGGAGEVEPVNLTGPLCTSIDRLAQGAMLPRVEPGALIAIHMSGAYGPTTSPVNFISHPIPREAVVDAEGRIVAADWLPQRAGVE